MAPLTDPLLTLDDPLLTRDVRDITMDMKRLSGGNLRAAGYDDENRVLVVELTSGTFQYAGVTTETWRRFADASSPWSFFRDNIEEDYPAKRIR